MSYMTEKEEVTNVFTVGDLDVGLHETEWDETTDKDGKDIYPGYTVYKNPTVKNISDTTNGAEPCYARMIVYVQDGNGNAITDQDALDLIEKQSVSTAHIQEPMKQKVQVQALYRERFRDTLSLIFPNCL